MIKKSAVVDRLESLVYQDWSTCRHPVASFIAEALPREFCGVLFRGKFAYASNGQFFIRVETKSTSLSKTLYYQYDTDMVTYEDVFAENELTEKIMPHFTRWYKQSVKVKKDDLYLAIKKAFPAIKPRRRNILQVTAMGGPLKLFFWDADSSSDPGFDSVPLWGADKNKAPINFFVNANYFYKALEIMDEYNIVEICTNPEQDAVVLLKGNNKRDFKPDIRIGIAKVDMAIPDCPSTKTNV